MKLSQAKRRRLGAKKLNPNIINEVMRDPRTQQSVGKVWQPDNASDHFEIVEGEEGDDVMLEVLLQPSLVPVTCRLVAPGGVWYIPDVDEEVAVWMPGGSLQEPFCMPRLSSGLVPVGVGTGTIVISGRAKILVHNGGATEPVARISELNALKDAHNEHKHMTATGLSSPATSLEESDLSPNPSFPVPDPINQFLPLPEDAPTSSVGAFAGTAVLEAE